MTTRKTGPKDAAHSDIFTDRTREVLSRHIATDGIARLESRVCALIASPPPSVPTVKQAESQLERLQLAATELGAAIRDAAWAMRWLTGSSDAQHLADLRKLPVQLEALRRVASSAAKDIAAVPQSERQADRGDRADTLTREVVRAVMDELSAAGVKLTQTPEGATAQCVQAVLEAAFPHTRAGAGVAHVRAMLGKPRSKRHSA